MQQTATLYLDRIACQIAEVAFESDGLFEGRLGLMWYYYTQWQATRQDVYREQGLAVLGEIFTHLNNDNPQLSGASMSVGVAGFCYVVTMLHRQKWLELDLEETLADLEAFLFESALELIEKQQLDFWHGAFGVLFYFLERLPTPQIKQWAEILVEKIVNEVRGDDDGLWFPDIQKPGDESIINFSLSHGQAAFLIILMQAAKKGVQTELVTSVVWRGVNFIQKHYKSADYKESFTHYPLLLNENTNEPTFSNRLALCYGDLNIALLLYRAAEFLQKPTLRRDADILGLGTLLRQTEKATQVSDAHLCHGAAGVAQFYYTLYKIAGHEGYLYLCWIDKTIALLHYDLEKETFKGREGSLLEGYVGISLALLSYIYHEKEQLTWAKLLLLNPSPTLR